MTRDLALQRRANRIPVQDVDPSIRAAGSSNAKTGATRIAPTLRRSRIGPEAIRAVERIPPADRPVPSCEIIDIPGSVLRPVARPEP